MRTPVPPIDPRSHLPTEVAAARNLAQSILDRIEVDVANRNEAFAEMERKEMLAATILHVALTRKDADLVDLRDFVGNPSQGRPKRWNEMLKSKHAEEPRWTSMEGKPTTSHPFVNAIAKMAIDRCEWDARDNEIGMLLMSLIPEEASRAKMELSPRAHAAEAGDTMPDDDDDEVGELEYLNKIV